VSSIDRGLMMNRMIALKLIQLNYCDVMLVPVDGGVRSLCMKVD
jgi:hypothetical protein